MRNGVELRKLKHTPSVQSEILKLVDDGKSYREISNTLGVSRTSVWTIVRGHGMKANRPKKISHYRFLSEDVDRFVSLYSAGFGCVAIGKMFDISGATVYRYLKRRDIVLRSVQDGRRLRWIREKG